MLSGNSLARTVHAHKWRQKSTLSSRAQVLVNVVGALSELAKDQTNRLLLRKMNAIPALISLLTGTNPALLVNVTRAVGQCAREPDNMTYEQYFIGGGNFLPSLSVLASFPYLPSP